MWVWALMRPGITSIPFASIISASAYCASSAALSPMAAALLLVPSVFPSIKVFSNESVLHIRWPKYWSFSFSISLFNEYSGLISFKMDWFDCKVQSKGLSRVFSNTTVQKHQFFGAQLSL